jgi:hypothetical protein
LEAGDLDSVKKYSVDIAIKFSYARKLFNVLGESMQQRSPSMAMSKILGMDRSRERKTIIIPR